MALDDIMVEDKSMHWADAIARRLVSANPRKKKFVLAAGISPSGVIHVGNLRDVMTPAIVARALQEMGYQSDLIFSSDAYDIFRKVPGDIPKDFNQYLGLPLSQVPDPFKDGHESYARHFQLKFEDTLPELGIHPRIIYQDEEYAKNRYYRGIKMAMQKRAKIAEILSPFKTGGLSPEEKEEYYPMMVYCRTCHKGNTTKITDYDGEDKVTYKCSCGHEETADISEENIGKLKWNVDWPMRWGEEEVDFEPGGEDHATTGGSFEVASQIARKIYGIKPPMFQGYGFIGIEGFSKMSGSKGKRVSPEEMLEIYDPELLRYLFTKTLPQKPMTLFLGDQIIRQYDEHDRQVAEYKKGGLDKKERRSLELARVNPQDDIGGNPVPFRQVASFGQIAQGKLKQLETIFGRIGQGYDIPSLRTRLEKSQNWVRKYAQDYKVEVRKTPDMEFYRSLDPNARSQIDRLAREMGKNWNLDKLTTLVYGIPKEEGMTEDEKKASQKTFFSHVNKLLTGSGTAPRLSTFLLALGKPKAKRLLDFGQQKKG